MGRPYTGQIIVLESFPTPRATTNPYLRLLVGSLPDGVEVRYFSWWRAICGRYDVFHLHWPEVLLRGASPLKTLVRSILFTVLMVRIRFGRAVMVRTIHNEAPHEAPGPFHERLLGLCDRSTALWINLSEHTDAPTSAPQVTIPHGDYRDWYRDHLESGEDREPIPGRLLFFGLIRPYKGIDQLIRAFRSTEDSTLGLRIAGRVMDAELGRLITSSCESDDRVTAVDGYLDDDDLVAEMGAANLVVLPFTRSSNSGSLLLALSLGRPVLAPADPLVEQISVEVGPGWVHTFDRPLEAADLERAIGAVREGLPSEPPDLELRRWDRSGLLHEEAFRRALATERPRWSLRRRR